MGIDSKLIDKILTEEKRSLKIPLPHILKGFRDVLIVDGIEYRDAFHVTLKRDQITLKINESKLFKFREEEIRACMRHELCHILDYIEGKIDSGCANLGHPLSNAFSAEIYAAYTDYLTAKRFIKLYGLDYFKFQNEIGMEEFLNKVKNGIRQPPPICYNWTYALFKEAIKTSFYSKGDDRFPTGIWKMVDWLCNDFDYIDSLKIKWLAKVELLAFETLTVLENIDLYSILMEPIPKLCRDDVTFKLYKDSSFTKTVFMKNLMDRWIQRGKALGTK